jgi:hypothetical protein
MWIGDGDEGVQREAHGDDLALVGESLTPPAQE